MSFIKNICEIFMKMCEMEAKSNIFIDSDFYVCYNQNSNITIDNLLGGRKMKLVNGLLSSVEYGGRKFLLSDNIVIETDKGEYSLKDIEARFDGAAYVYSAQGAEFRLEYGCVKDSAFIFRKLTAVFSVQTVLKKVWIPAPDAECGFMYDTFVNASAAAFFRKGDTGLCMGFENPYCELEDGRLFFEPSLILNGGEVFECDLNFIGVYELFGEMIRPELGKTHVRANGRSHPRYRNPGEGIGLYFSEILEFNRYTAEYFDCDRKEFKFMTYDFFGNMPQHPKNDEEYKLYLEHIDAVCEMGCDTLLINPLCYQTIPTEDEKSVWEFFPEDTYAGDIFKYAREKGLKLGVYSGSAGNEGRSDSSINNYADIPAWKKTDVLGNVSKENCIASDEFVDWFIKVQINTIKKYGLDVWVWDPGPGNGFFCYSADHGHLPGKGDYKGFRNTLRIMKALKDACPGLYFQGFHGNKEFGLWGFKYIDQHEAFWENDVYVFNPMYDDISVDRVTANNIRQQSIWNYYYRFMPATLNHGIANRMVQAHWMMMFDLDYAVDFIGYEYALISALAAGGPITLMIPPRHPDAIKGYKEFYSKYIALAKDLFKYSKYTLPIGEQVGCGIDAVSKLHNNCGYIFAFNPFCQDHEFKFTVDRRSGFEDSGHRVHLLRTYPYNTYIGEYGFGDEVKTVVPGFGCIVIKVTSDREDFVCETPKPSLPRTLTSEGGVYSFEGSAAMRALLEEIQVEERAINVQEEYKRRFNRVNIAWSRPDRLWLNVACGEADPDSVIRVNGTVVDWTQDFLSHWGVSEKGVVFADITDAVRFDGNNEIELCGFSESSVYLHYPRPRRELIPDEAPAFVKQDMSAPVLDGSVTVTDVRLNSDNIMVPGELNTLTVTVNLPAEQLEGVYATNPITVSKTGFDLKRDMVLEYRDGVWTKTFNSGIRDGLIIDVEKIVVWAVTKDKRESRAYKLRFDWLLS